MPTIVINQKVFDLIRKHTPTMIVGESKLRPDGTWLVGVNDRTFAYLRVSVLGNESMNAAVVRLISEMLKSPDQTDKRMSKIKSV